jgi:hypothetical protein
MSDEGKPEIYLTPGRMKVEDLRECGKLPAYAWPRTPDCLHSSEWGYLVCEVCANDKTPAELVNWFVYHPSGSTMR